MTFSLLVLDYTRWHYTTAPAALFHIGMNFLLYLEHQFMIGMHARTLFSPWHRMTESRSKKWDWEEWATTILVNGVSRLLGFTLRTFIILAGLLLMLLGSIGLIAAFFAWFFAPVLVSGSVILGISAVSIFVL
jgi:hypothetical protein